jgi:uncharacterized protein
MSSTILITGGTGLVGKALTKLLISKGHKVIILTRSPKANSDTIQYAKWDTDTQTIDGKAIQQADYIIHLAGAGVADKRWTEARKKEIEDSRTQSSALLIKGLKEHDNKVKAIISASAIGWYGADLKNVKARKPFIETDPADTAFLGNTCKLWEESIEPVAALGKRLVKLRIGIVLSKDGGAYYEFRKPLRFGLAAILGSGKQVVSWIHIDDLCNMMLHAIENEQVTGVYNAVAPHPVDNKTLTLEIARQVRGKFVVPMYAPSFVLKVMLGGMSVEVLKSATVSSAKIQHTGFAFTLPTIELAVAALEK